MHILVTGGSGFIGTHLVRRLVNEGHQVTVVSLNNKSVDDAVHIRENILNVQFSQFSNIDVIVHFAAMVSVKECLDKPYDAAQTNVLGTIRMLELAKKLGAKFVFASSAATYGEPKTIPMHEQLPLHPMSPYALHKVQGEEYCRLYYELYGITCVALRFFNVYGPGQQPNSAYASLIPAVASRILRTEEIMIRGDGKQTRDFIFISDIVDGVVRALDYNGFLIANLGSGVQTTVLEIVNTLISISGKDITVNHVDPIPEPRVSVADISCALGKLDWKPQVSLEEGLKQAFDYYKGEL